MIHPAASKIGFSRYAWIWTTSSRSALGPWISTTGAQISKIRWCFFAEGQTFAFSIKDDYGKHMTTGISMNHKSLFMVSTTYFAHIESATAFMQLWSLSCQLRCPAGGGGHVDVYFFGSVRFSSSWECEATSQIVDDVLNANHDESQAVSAKSNLCCLKLFLLPAAT